MDDIKRGGQGVGGKGWVGVSGHPDVLARLSFPIWTYSVHYTPRVNFS